MRDKLTAKNRQKGLSFQSIRNRNTTKLAASCNDVHYNPRFMMYSVSVRCRSNHRWRVNYKRCRDPSFVNKGLKESKWGIGCIGPGHIIAHESMFSTRLQVFEISHFYTFTHHNIQENDLPRHSLSDTQHSPHCH